MEIKIPYHIDIKEHLKENFPDIVSSGYQIISKSLDSRKANLGVVPKYIYQIEKIQNNLNPLPSIDIIKKQQIQNLGCKPIILGMGPAGLFCALKLGELGIPCIVIERGERAKERMRSIAQFWRYGKLNPESNVCYGEGGAGFFSDGKLYTRVESPHLEYFLNKLVELGAPEHVKYYKNPHLGSNGIRKLLEVLTQKLEDQGHELLFNSCVEEILFDQNQVKGVTLKDGRKLFSTKIVLAIGHSAHEMYEFLKDQNVSLKQKDFAVGLRIEHKRSFINQSQYGNFAQDPLLETARYRLSYHDHQLNKGIYSFCMCPGGIVLSSGTDSKGTVVNGMSNSKHNAPWSNSALIMSVKSKEDFATKNILEGMKYQIALEKKAYELVKSHHLPAQRASDFILKKTTPTQKLPISSTPSGIKTAPLHELFTQNQFEFFLKGLEKFNRNIPDFIGENALLMGVETRTSSPVTVLRDPESFESISHKGLFPCGEGAGYAGGISSAALDGIKIAISLANSL